MFKKVMSISFKITSLLLLVLILSFNVVATQYYQWNFTGTDEGWTHVTTAGGTADVFTDNKWQSDGGGSQYAEAWYNISDKLGLNILNSFPLNYSAILWNDSTQYWVFGLSNSSTFTSPYDLYNVHVHFRPADTPDKIRIAEKPVGAGGYTECNVVFHDLSSHPTRINLYFPDEDNVDVYVDGSKECNRTFVNSPIQNISNLLMIMGRVANNKIDNVSIELPSCESEFYNTSYSNWVSMGECEHNTGLILENRTYITTDLNGCVGNVTHTEYQNDTCYSCTDVYLNNEVNNMNLVLILFYISIMTLGYIMMTQGNYITGLLFWIMTIFLDFLIVNNLHTYFIDGNVIDNSWQSGFVLLAGIGLFLWSLIKISAGLLIKNKRG